MAWTRAGIAVPGARVVVPGAGVAVPGAGVAVPGAGVAVPGAGAAVPGVRAAGSWTTGGRLPHRPVAGLGARARAPELSVSQPSAGQVSVSTADTTRSPAEPAAASRQ